MELEERINAGWGRHEAETDAVAAELEEHIAEVGDVEQAASICALASHVMGEHLGDWGRAATLMERAVEGIEDEPGLTSSVILLGVARELAEDAAGAEAAFEHARALAGNDMLVEVRTRFARVAAYMGVSTAAEVVREHDEAMSVVATMEDTESVDRLIAIISNNAANHLLDLEELSSEEAAGMIRIAQAAMGAWKRAGDWTNHERADYLVALVHNRIAEWATGLAAADAGLVTIAANGEEPVDEAFLQLARALALRGLGEDAAADEALGVADALAVDWDEGLRAWYDAQREKSLVARA
jgi:hypothetical protein